MDGDLFDELCPGRREDQAAKVGVSPETLWRFRRGEIGPRLEVARRIAQRLGTTVDALWPVPGTDARSR